MRSDGGQGPPRAHAHRFRVFSSLLLLAVDTSLSLPACLPACQSVCLPLGGIYITFSSAWSGDLGNLVLPRPSASSKPYLEAHVATMSEKQVVDALMYSIDAHRCCSRKAFLLASICLIMSCFFFPICSARCCHQKYTIGGVASKRPMAVK